MGGGIATTRENPRLDIAELPYLPFWLNLTGCLGGGINGAKEPSREERYLPRDEEIGPDVFEVSGSVKWFEATGSFFRMNTCLTFFCT
jgi:hypothetical protein